MATKDYSREELFMLENFKGENKILDSTKLTPGEHVYLKNIFLDTGSMVNIPVAGGNSARGNIPVPVEENYNYDYSEDFTQANSHFTAVADQKYMVKIATSAWSAHEIRCIFVLMKTLNATSVITPLLYSDNAGSPNTDLSDVGGGSNPTITHTFTIATADTNRVWRAIYFAPAASISVDTNIWIGFSVNKTTEIYCADYYEKEWKVWTGASWVAFDTAHASKIGGPAFAYVKTGTSITSPFKAFALELNGKSYNPLVSNTAITPSVDLLPGFIVEDDDRDFDNLFLSGTGANSGQYISTRISSVLDYGRGGVISNTNLVLNGNVLAICNPGTSYCIPLSLVFNDNLSYSSNDVHLDVERFQNNIVVACSGTDTNNKYPFYLGIVDYNGWNGYSALPFTSTVPTSPVSVELYNNCLIFANADGYSYRMYYSPAGQLDSFDTATLFENIDQGGHILNMIKYGDELLFVFGDKIKSFKGVPGNASLQTILNVGILKRDCYVKLTDGKLIFFTLSGVYIYAGTFVPVKDMTDLFNYIGDTPVELVFFDYRNKKTLFLERSVDFSNPVTYRRAMLNYENGQWGEHSITANAYPMYRGGELVYATTSSASTYVAEGSTYNAFDIKSGLLDPEPTVIQKEFQRMNVEITPTASTCVIGMVANFDGGYSASASVDCQGTGTSKIISMDLNTSSNRIQYRFYSDSATAEQIKIHRIKIYYIPTLGK